MPDDSYLKGLTGSITDLGDTLTKDRKESRAAFQSAADAETEAGKKRAATIAEAEKPGGALVPPETQPFQSPPQEDIWKAFGSPAMWIATLGGALARQPIAVSLNAGANVIKAVNQKNLQAAQSAYDQWKVATDNAIKLQKFKEDAFDKIMSIEGQDATSKLAQAKALGASFQMDEHLFRDMSTLEAHLANEKTNNLSLEKSALEITEMRNKMAAQAAYGAAVKLGDPVKIKQALADLAPYVPGLVTAEAKEADGAVKYGPATEVSLKDKDGKTSTVLAQQDPKTGQWVTADEKRTPLEGVTAKLTGQQASQQLDFDDEGVKSTVKAIANYEAQLPSSSRNPVLREQLLAQVLKENPDYNEGDYVNINTAKRAFNTGKQGDTTRSLNVSVKHLEVLKELGDSLRNGDTQRINEVANRLNTEFGDPRANNFNLARTIVADEVEKAIKSGVGTQEERDQLQARFTSMNSPEQMAGVIDTAEKLMGGQLLGLERQYQTSTRLKDFRDKLFPETVKALGADKAVDAAPLPKDKASAVDGKLYQTSAGPMKWDAKKDMFVNP